MRTSEDNELERTTMQTDKVTEIVEMVREYFLKTIKDEYTDVGDVWCLLDSIHDSCCGRTLEEWLADEENNKPTSRQ